MLSFIHKFNIEGFVIAPLIMLVLSFVSYFVTKRYFIPIIHTVICNRKKKWQTIFDKHQPFRQLSFLAPAVIITFGLQYIPDVSPYILRILNFYIVVNITLMLKAVLYTFMEIYNLYSISKERPIKSYVQMSVIFIYIIGGIIGICQLLDKDPWLLLSSIGALTAVLLLVFRDTILSFIAGMQILSNNLIKKDDWIEVPAFGANGTVIDVALHIIKVQNWDKTIVIIPTYKVIESGFKNWRGMYEAGGRRIKRSLLIDQTSISFLDEKTLDKINNSDFVKKKIKISKNEIGHKTNLGAFRQYAEAYLRAHPKVHQEYSFFIRHLDPTSTGVPIEICIFSTETARTDFENVQAEIFEHLMAIIQLFNLRLYQMPSGYDYSYPQDLKPNVESIQYPHFGTS